MRIRLSRPSTLVLGGLLALGFSGPDAGAQTREILSKQIAVASDEATLQLELEDRGSFEIGFEDETVYLDGEPIGRFTPGDELVSAWRALLGRAVALDDGPLARALVEWAPPASLDGPSEDLARRIDRALEDVVGLPARDAEAEPEAAGELAGLTELLRRAEHLAELARAVEGLDFGDAELHIGDDVTVSQGDRVEGALIVVDGELEVRGEVDGSVVVAGGTLRTYQGSRILGDVRLADARLVRNGGEIAGEVREISEGVEGAAVEVGEAVDTEEIRKRVREELREELRRELRNEIRVDVDDLEDRGVFHVLRYVGRGVGGLFENAFIILILSLLGALVLYFGDEKLSVVAETARRSPGRAATVGIAGAFLLLPVYLLGMLALAVSIIGIPVILAWAPLFPVVATLAVGLGYFAVARNVGAWLSRQEYPYLNWIRTSNPYTLLVGGLVGLMAAFVLANVVRLGGPWLGFLRGLLVTVGILVTAGAALIGFGAVLITRGGRRPEYYAGDYFSAADLDLDDDPEAWDAAFGSARTAPSTESASAEEPGRSPGDDAPASP